MQRIVTVLALALALACAFSVHAASAQESPPDPLIEPREGEPGSRFQIVGQAGWTPGETVTLRIGFTTERPLDFDGPYPFERTLVVLRDGTWSFPVNVNDALLGQPLGSRPGYLVVLAQSPTRVSKNAFVYTVNGARPAGTEQIAGLGFGPPAPPAAISVALALFAAATGAMLVASGTMRRHAA